MRKLSPRANHYTIYWLWFLLLLAIVASALTVVYNEHKLSVGHLQINQLAADVDVHLLRYARLLAEKNVLMNPYRLKIEAVEKFAMQAPAAHTIRVLK